MPPTPGNPGGPPGYVLDWERKADRDALAVAVAPGKLGPAPQGWSGEWDPVQRHRANPAAPLEPQVRSASSQWEPVRSGTHSVRCQLYSGDKTIFCGARSELAGDWEPPRAVAATPTERWYGFSVYLPRTWLPDPAPESVTQWHQDGNAPGGSPPLAILTRRHGDGLGHWYVGQRKWNVNDVTFHDAGPCALGEWTDWVVHVKWSGGGDGLLEVWRNGTRIAPLNPMYGRTTFANSTRHYIKIGIYKWLWNKSASGTLTPKTTCGSPAPNTSNQTRRVMYHDELRVVDGAGNRATVSPPGKRPPPVP